MSDGLTMNLYFRFFVSKVLFCLKSLLSITWMGWHPVYEVQNEDIIFSCAQKHWD